MRREALLLAAVLLLGQVAGEGTSFAEIVITAAGDEEFDIATGVTTLAEGGNISHREHGIELQAEFIRHLAGEYVETGPAEVTGPFGHVQAGSVYLDLLEDTLHAGDGITFEGHGLTVAGEKLRFHDSRGVVELSGDVVSAGPDFTAARVLFDTASGTVLLFGPYSYDDGLFTLSADSEGSLLELTPGEEDAEGGSASGEGGFTASSSPSAETLALFEAWLD